MSNAGMYHKKVDCQVTNTAHEKTDTAIKEDPNCQTSFFFIVFHKNLILDNYIFSGNNSILKISWNGMKLESKHEANPFKKKKKKIDVLCMCMWKRIGNTGGTSIHNGDVQEEVSNIFD
jgi:hypothetical protein